VFPQTRKQTEATLVQTTPSLPPSHVPDLAQGDF